MEKMFDQPRSSKEWLMKAQSLSHWFVCFLFLTAASSGRGDEPGKSPEVPVCKPLVREVSDFLEFTGRTEASKTVDIRARVSGLLSKISFKEGTSVKKGEPLFEIDSRVQQAALDQAKAQMGL